MKLFTLLLLVATTASAVQVPFAGKYPIATGFTGTTALAVGDVDGDGTLDFVFGNQFDGRIIVARNTSGTGTNGVGSTIATNFVTVGALDLADLDRDGDLDLAGASIGLDTVAWWANVGGAGTNWSPFIVTTNHNGARDVEAADVDGDGDLDLLTAADDGNRISWWENRDGIGNSWSGRVIQVGLAGPVSITAADMDRDGKLDVVSSANSSNEVAWWRNANGTGTLWTLNIISTNIGAPVVQRVADMDGDGDPDVVSTYFSGSIRWWANPGPSGAWEERIVDTGVSTPIDLRITDLDRDGDLDLVGLSFLPDDVLWWERLDASGTNWTRRTIEDVLKDPWQVALGDVDRDGDDDIVATGSADGEVGLWKNLTLSNQTFFAHTNVISLAPGEPNGARFGDLNRDGNVDVVACATNGIRLWFGSGGPSPTWTPLTIDATNGSTHIELADLDDDGDTDVIGADYNGQSVRWWQNSSTGIAWIARSIASFSESRRPAEVAVGDVNGDGRLDVAAVYNALQRIDVYLNAGGATNWTTNIVNAIFEDGNAIGLGDLDSDGDLDLAVGALVGSGSTNQVAWFQNLGGGTNWAERTVDADGEAQQRIRATDFDNDGDLDLVGTGGNPNAAWWENTAGDASAWLLHGVETTCCFFAGTDVLPFDADFDGDTDLGYVSQGYFIYYDNDGSDTNFTRRIVATFGGGYNGTAADLADVNRDGLPDILVSEYVYASGQGRLQWFRNSPHGDLGVTKTASQNPVFRGRAFVYGIEVTNKTPHFVRNVSIHDPLPAPVTWLTNLSGNASVLSNAITWTIGDLPGLTRTAISVVVQVDFDFIGLITNSAASRATITDTNVVSDNIGTITTRVEYAERILVSTNFAANAVDVADLDRDGDLDIAASRDSSSVLAWFENTAPDGEAWNQRTINSPFTADDLAIADVNRDGYPDVAACTASGNILAWFANDSTGGVWTLRSIPLGGASQPRSLDVADADGDGDVDVFLAASASGFLLFRNMDQTGATWNVTTLHTNLAGERSIKAADFDLDGDLDFVGGASEVPSHGGLLWGESLDGSGTNWTIHILMTTGVFAVHCADVDRDGDPDLLSASYSSSGTRTNSWWENTRLGGTNWIRRNINVGLNGDEWLDLDADRDADTDILLASISGLHLFENQDAVGSAWKTNAYSADGNCTALGVGDINRDGAVDVVATSNSVLYWWHMPPKPAPAAFPVKKIVDTNAPSVLALDLADVDRDGDLDLFGAISSAGRLAWWRNVSNATAWTASLVDTNFAGPVGAVAADLDGDGDNDLIAPSFTNSQIAWWANFGNGASWSNRLIVSGYNNPAAVAAADLDLDGDLDLACARFQLVNAVQWFSNLNGNATAWSTNELPGTALLPQCIHAARINPDARPDLVVGCANGLIWYENLANTNFQRYVIDNLLTDVVDVDSADLDRDGDTDILGATEDGNRLYWWMNSNGLASSWVRYGINIDANGATGLRPVDLDSDGDWDVIATLQDTNRVIWMENLGGATAWVERVVQEGFALAVAPLAGDFNRDGDPDIAAAARGGTEVAWWPQLPGSAADFDNDGLPDSLDPDDDNDGMPDVFETQHGFDPYNPADAALDADGDTSINLFEYIAGTNPTNLTDYFRVLTFSNAPTHTVVFSGAAGRVYTLEVGTNLISGTWSPVAGQVDIPGPGALQNLVHTNASTSAFYRVTVELP